MADEPTPPPPSPRDGVIRWWDVLIAFFGGNALGVALTVLVAIGAFLVAMIAGYRPDVTALIHTLQYNFWLNHAVLVLSDLGLAATIWLVAWRRLARPLAHYFAPTGTGNIVLALLSGVGLSVILNGGNELLQRSGLVTLKDLPGERALIPHDNIQLVATIIVVALFAPFVEELFFRGMFFDWLRRIGSTALAATVTGLCFAVVHGHLLLHPGAQGVLYTVELFVAGLVLAAWVARTGSLRTSWATHAAYNATAIAFSVLLP